MCIRDMMQKNNEKRKDDWFVPKEASVTKGDYELTKKFKR